MIRSSEVEPVDGAAIGPADAPDRLPWRVAVLVLAGLCVAGWAPIIVVLLVVLR